MGNFLKMANIQAALFLYLAVGAYCRKKNIFNNEMRDRLTDFVLWITLPCMVFESFHIPFTPEILHRSAIALAAALGTALVSLLCGTFLFRRVPGRERPVMQYGILVNNAAFAGLPIISGMYGSEGLLIASIFIIPNRILMWTAGISYFTRDADRKGGIRRTLLNPSVIAVYLGLARMIWDIPLPGFLDTAAGCIGDCTAPLAMALVGAILADTDIRSALDVRSLYLVVLRQLLMPLLCLAVLRALGVEALSTGVCVILTGMPIASTTAILAQKYGADAQFASKCVFVSTLSSLLTAPLLTVLL